MKKIYEFLIFVIILTVSITIISLILSSKIDFTYPIIKTFNIFGIEETNTHLVSNYKIEINNFCSGLFTIVIFLSIVFSPITKIKNKIKFAIIGSLILYISNILRIITLIKFSNYIDANILHISGWIIMSSIIFILWIKQKNI